MPTILQVAQRYWNSHAFVNMAVKLATKASAAGNGAQAVTGACIAVGIPSLPTHGERRHLNLCLS